VRSWLAGFPHLESPERCGERIALGCGEIRFMSPDSNVPRFPCPPIPKRGANRKSDRTGAVDRTAARRVGARRADPTPSLFDRGSEAVSP